jgi:hypothetical protein
MPEPVTKQDQDLPAVKPDEAISDPGEMEGKGGVAVVTKTDDKKHEPVEGSPRWNEIYKSAKDGERKVDDLTKRIEGKDADIEALRKHNTEIAKSVAELKTKQETNAHDEESKERREKMDNLREKRDAAYDSGDNKAVANIQDDINDLRAEETRSIAEHKAEVPAATVTTEATTPSGVSPAVETFIRETPWYDSSNTAYDPMMTSTVASMDGVVSKDPAWNTKPIEAQFAEVRRRIEERFKYKPVEGGGGTPPPGALPIDAGGGGNPNQVTLSVEERRVANLLFPGDDKAEEKYAAQKI